MTLLLASIFLAPAFAWAALALLAIPIIIHLLNRRRYRVVHWAAMEYLLEAMRQNRRRLKFQDLILLMLRCSAIALAGFALARPIACSNSAAGRIFGQSSGLHVIVIDNSGSMAYLADRPSARSHLDQARLVAKGIISQLNSGQDAVAIITTAARSADDGTPGRPTIVGSVTYDLAAAAQVIDQIPQTFAATDLPGALRQAMELDRKENGLTQRTLHLLTDSTRSAWQGPAAESLQQVGPQLASLYRIVHYNLGLPGQSNLAVADLQVGGNFASTAIPADFSATVRAYGQSATGSLQWQLGDTTLPPRQNIALSTDTPPQVLPQVVLDTPGPRRLTATLTPDDPLPADNVRYHAMDVVSRLNVLIVEGDRSAGGGSASFLELALSPTRPAGESANSSSSPVAFQAISDLELSGRALGEYQAVILANVPRLSADQADQLAKFVRDGGCLVMFMGDNVSSDNYNQELRSRGLLPGTLVHKAQTLEGAQPQRFAFNPTGLLHPLLSVFRGEEKSGLATARIFAWWQMELPAGTHAQRVLDFVGGDPAIVLDQVGAGRVVFVATSADSKWTTLPAKPAYVALVHEVLSGTVTASDQWMNLAVGQRLSVPPRIGLSGAPRLLDASGRPLLMDLATSPDGHKSYRSPALEIPGVYRLETGSTVYPIAVNFPAVESDIRTLEPPLLKQALGDVPMQFETDQPPSLETAHRETRDFGWTFLAIAATLFAAECFLAMWFRR